MFFMLLLKGVSSVICVCPRRHWEAADKTLTPVQEVQRGLAENLFTVHQSDDHPPSPQHSRLQQLPPQREGLRLAPREWWGDRVKAAWWWFIDSGGEEWSPHSDLQTLPLENALLLIHSLQKLSAHSEHQDSDQVIESQDLKEIWASSAQHA